MREATAQQKLFVDEYLKLRKSNQGQAAINAGYSPRSAVAQASQLLNNPRVKAYLDKREAQLEQELRQEFFFDAIEARKVMYSILKNDESDDRDRINVAKDFLDRAGFKPVDKQDIQHSGRLDHHHEVEGLNDDELHSGIKATLQAITDLQKRVGTKMEE